MFDWIGDFFKALFDLIPKLVYLFYASLSCVIDVLQLLFRKLAGLDVYYLDGKAVSGDLVTNFIAGILGIDFTGGAYQSDRPYSALTTVFWSFVLFGIIVTFIATFVALIKSHYSYDEKSAKGPMQYVYAAGKAIVRIVSVPVIVVLGMYLSQAVLQALDLMTSTNNGSVVELFGQDALDAYLQEPTLTARGQANNSTVKGERTYIYYDIFGFSTQISYGTTQHHDAPNVDLFKFQMALVASTNQTFSGSMFKVAAYNANRARIYNWNDAEEDPAIRLDFSGSANDPSFKLFANATTNEDLADMIDTAFACNLHTKNDVDLRYGGTDLIEGYKAWVSTSYFTNFLTSWANSFSKFNVGMVWYYYDLWNFNFIVGFGSILVCLTIFINIVMGLMTRLFMCIGLFLVAPPLFGLGPLDGGKAGKSWTENFLKQVLMAYGAVVGMNIIFLILPYINQIDFFNIPIADAFVQTLIIIVGLITIKAFIATLSGLIGAADANDTGGKISEEVGSTVGKAAMMTLGTAKIAGKIGLGAAKLGGKAAFRVADVASGGAMTNLKTRATMMGARLKRGIRGKAGRDLDDAQADFNSKHSATMKAENDLAEAQQELETASTPGEIAAAQAKVNAAKSTLRSARQDEKISKGALDTAQGAYDKTRRARFVNGTKKLSASLGKGFNDVFYNANKIFGNDKFIGGFKNEMFWKKLDHQKRSADAVEGLRDYLQGSMGRNGSRSGGAIAGMSDTMSGMRDEMGRGFTGVQGDITSGNLQRVAMHSDMNHGFANQLAETQGMRTDMNAGFAANETATNRVWSQTASLNKKVGGVTNPATGKKEGGLMQKVDETNATLSKIESETDDIKTKAKKIQSDVHKLETRSKKAETDRAAANAELQKANAELEKIEQSVNNIDTKIPPTP